VLDQIAQDAKCLRRQANPLIISIVPVTPETLVDGVQLERRKLLHAEPAVLCLSPLPRYIHTTGGSDVSHEKAPSSTMQISEMPHWVSGILLVNHTRDFPSPDSFAPGQRELFQVTRVTVKFAIPSASFSVAIASSLCITEVFSSR